MALYRGLPGREEDADDPEKIVRRVQEVSAVLYHLEQVGGASGVLLPGRRRALTSWALPEGQGAGLGSVGGACVEPGVFDRGLEWELVGALNLRSGTELWIW